MDDSILEVGIKEFCKGIDRLEIANMYYDKIILAKTNRNNKNNDLNKNLENSADFVTRAIDLMLKAMAYIYVEDVDHEALRGHSQIRVIKVLQDTYDKAPDLKEIDELLNKIARSSYLIHNFISTMAYEGMEVYEPTLDKFIDFASELRDFGYKHNLNDFDSFKRV